MKTCLAQESKLVYRLSLVKRHVLNISHKRIQTQILQHFLVLLGHRVQVRLVFRSLEPITRVLHGRWVLPNG